MTDSQKRLTDILIHLSSDEIEEQELFEQLAQTAMNYYKIKFVPLNELQDELYYQIIAKSYDYEVSKYFFDSVNTMAYRKKIPRLVEDLTKNI